MKSAALLSMGLGAVLLACTGTYAAGSETAENEAKVQALVESGLELVRERGKAAALEEINKLQSPFVNGDSYLFAMSLDNIALGGGAESSHRVRGKDLSGIEFVQEMTRRAKAEGSGWVETEWPKPGSTKPSAKRTFFKRVPDENFLIASGYYLD